MKSNMCLMLIVFTFCVLSTKCAPVEEGESASIVHYEFNQSPNGEYSFNYETSDGQKQKQSGKLKSVDEVEDPILVVTGSYSWISPDGVNNEYNYVGDENGYRLLKENKSTTSSSTESPPPSSNYYPPGIQYAPPAPEVPKPISAVAIKSLISLNMM